MDISLISERYARALLDYAESMQKAETVYHEMNMLSESFYNFRTLRLHIESPIISEEQRNKLIVLAAGGNVSDVFLKFINLVNIQHRLSCLQEMALKYCDLYRESHNIHYCKFTTAVAIDDVELEKIRSTIGYMTGKDAIIEIHKNVDQNIIGGFIFEIDSKLMDKSVSHQLTQIKNELVDKNQRIV